MSPLQIATIAVYLGTCIIQLSKQGPCFHDTFNLIYRMNTGMLLLHLCGTHRRSPISSTFDLVHTFRGSGGDQTQFSSASERPLCKHTHTISFPLPFTPLPPTTPHHQSVYSCPLSPTSAVPNTIPTTPAPSPPANPSLQNAAVMSNPLLTTPLVHTFPSRHHLLSTKLTSGNRCSSPGINSRGAVTVLDASMPDASTGMMPCRLSGGRAGTGRRGVCG